MRMAALSRFFKEHLLGIFIFGIVTSVIYNGIHRSDASRLTTPSTAGAPPTPDDRVYSPPRQKLEHFIVEVTRAQTDGDSATVYVRFTSAASERIKMFLADGLLGHHKTFLVDDSGQHYDLDNSSGIGSCCFGYGGEWHGGVLDLAAKGSADVTLTFLRRSRSGEPQRVPKNFTLTAELTVGNAVKLLSSENLQWQSSGSAGISIAGIVPR
jgi:hypothetical protein